jgi:hypothetical protein
VSLVVFDKATFAVSEKLLGEVASYIDEHYVDEHRVSRRELLDVEREALKEATVPPMMSEAMLASSMATPPLTILSEISTRRSPRHSCG